MLWKIDPKVQLTYHAPDLNADDLTQLVAVLNDQFYNARSQWSLGLKPLTSSAKVIITHAELAADYGSNPNYTVLRVEGMARMFLSKAAQRNLVDNVGQTLDAAELNSAMTLWPMYTAAMLGSRPWGPPLIAPLSAQDCLMYMAAIEASPELTRLYCEASYEPSPIEAVTPFSASTPIRW